MNTTTLIWDETYETGDPVIDQQHREVLALVDELDESDLDSVGQIEVFRVLGHVMDFTFSHFEMEETLMTRVGYPPADHIQMTEQHHDFKSYARLRVLEFRFNEIESMKPFEEFLRSWLVDHEFGLDRKLATFIRTSGQSATAHPAPGTSGAS